jgi:hypothetical protein
MIFIFPLWTFHLYAATFQQHLHMEYISLSWSDRRLLLTRKLLNQGFLPLILSKSLDSQGTYSWFTFVKNITSETKTFLISLPMVTKHDARDPTLKITITFSIHSNTSIPNRYSGIGSPLFAWKTFSPFLSFFLVFLWLTCAISSEKSHYFISSEKSHYFLQFTIQPLPRLILIY